LKNAQEQKKVIIYCENQNAIILNSLWFVNVIFVAWKDKRSVFDSSKDMSVEAYWLIDRDFLTDWEIEIIEKNSNTKVLRYYCFENYLYHPDNLEEYFAWKKTIFNKHKYISKILKHTDDEWDVKLNISTVAISRRDGYSDVTKFVETLTWSLTDIDIIKNDFGSWEFDKIYKYYTMKKKKKVFHELNNLIDTKLSETKWFHKQIELILEKIL
jgi:hypothetical protein